LTFEESPVDIDYCLGRTRRGRKPHELRPHGRCDLLLWSSGARPRAIIEVKRNTKNIEADVRRLAAMLLEDRRLSFGVLACYICQHIDNKSEAQAREKLERILGNVLAKTQSIAEGRVRFKLSNHSILRAKVSDGRWLWRPVCFIFTPIRVNK